MTVRRLVRVGASKAGLRRPLPASNGVGQSSAILRATAKEAVVDVETA